MHIIVMYALVAQLEITFFGLIAAALSGGCNAHDSCSSVDCGSRNKSGSTGDAGAWLWLWPKSNQTPLSA